MKTASAEKQKRPENKAPLWSGRRRHGARQSRNGYEIVIQGPCHGGELKLMELGQMKGGAQGSGKRLTPSPFSARRCQSCEILCS